MIGDAKYKPAENIGNKDYLQVLAYMLRFDAKQGYYFYPCGNHVWEHKLQLNKGSTYENNVEPRENICVTKLGVNIPGYTDTYAAFVHAMKIEESVFVEALNNGM